MQFKIFFFEITIKNKSLRYNMKKIIKELKKKYSDNILYHKLRLTKEFMTRTDTGLAEAKHIVDDYLSKHKNK